MRLSLSERSSTVRPTLGARRSTVEEVHSALIQRRTGNIFLPESYFTIHQGLNDVKRFFGQEQALFSVNIWGR